MGSLHWSGSPWSGFAVSPNLGIDGASFRIGDLQPVASVVLGRAVSTGSSSCSANRTTTEFSKRLKTCHILSSLEEFISRCGAKGNGRYIEQHPADGEPDE